MLQPKYNSLSFPPTSLSECCFWHGFVVLGSSANVSIVPQNSFCGPFLLIFSYICFTVHLIHSHNFQVISISYWASNLYFQFEFLIKKHFFFLLPKVITKIFHWCFKATWLYWNSSPGPPASHPLPGAASFLQIETKVSLDALSPLPSTWSPIIQAPNGLPILSLLPWLCFNKSFYHFSSPWLKDPPIVLSLFNLCLLLSTLSLVPSFNTHILHWDSSPLPSGYSSKSSPSPTMPSIIWSHK